MNHAPSKVLALLNKQPFSKKYKLLESMFGLTVTYLVFKSYKHKTCLNLKCPQAVNLGFENCKWLYNGGDTSCNCIVTRGEVYDETSPDISLYTLTRVTIQSFSITSISQYFDLKKIVFPSELLKLPWQSPLLAYTIKYWLVELAQYGSVYPLGRYRLPW